MPRVCRVLQYELQPVSEAMFSQMDEQSSEVALQQLRQSQQGRNSLQSMAELLCSQPGLQQAYTDDNLWDAAVKPFVPLPLASLQPKIKVSLPKSSNSSESLRQAFCILINNPSLAVLLQRHSSACHVFLAILWPFGSTHAMSKGQ